MKKSQLSNSLWKIWRTLLYAGPAALFFSYHPVISIGSTETTNLEFSLAEIWLLLFSLFSLINLKSFFKFYRKKLFLLLAFPAYAALSLLWTPNFLRAFLTAGLLFLLVFAVLNIYQYLQNNPPALRTLQKILILSAAAFSAFCWLQCLLDLAGVSRETSLLCLGCTYSAFGFPHPNGFAIEPQFAGNLLLAPALLALYDLLFNPSAPLFKHKSLRLLLPSFLVTTLFLTFSRGAIYSFLLGLAVIFFMRFSTRTLWLIPITLGSLALALLAQGTFAAISPTSDTFTSGITKSLHQLSLGKIDLRPSEVTTPVETPEPITTESSATDNNQSTFSGYVEDSTNIRVGLTDKALDIWDDSKTNLLFGTGLGSAGTVLYQKYPSLGSPKEIVQNQYASLLLELGLLGTLLALITFIFILRTIKPDALFLAVLIAYLASLFFFSGLPNALHIWIFIILCHMSPKPAIRRPSRHQKH